MKRILIIGCPGSGKSTFARGLAERTGLPLHYLDMLYWNADRTTVSRDVFDARLEEAMSGEEWIIDGNYSRTMERRLEKADTVFFFDLPAEVCIEGVYARRGRVRPDMPWVETEDDVEFMEYIRGFGQTNRPEIITYLEKYRDRFDVHVFCSRKEADEYLLSLEL